MSQERAARPRKRFRLRYVHHGRLRPPARIHSDISAFGLYFSGRTWLILYSFVRRDKVVKAPWARGLNVNVTVENLRKLHLKPDMPEHPVNPEAKQPTESRAAMFINNTTNTRLKAYQGTTGWKDVKMDIGQDLGNRTF